MPKIERITRRDSYEEVKTLEGGTRMKEKEMIEVYIDIRGGKTVCICKKDKKRCRKDCELDLVERDRFRNWERDLWKDRYGKSN